MTLKHVASCCPAASQYTHSIPSYKMFQRLSYQKTLIEKERMSETTSKTLKKNSNNETLMVSFRNPIY